MDVNIKAIGLVPPESIRNEQRHHDDNQQRLTALEQAMEANTEVTAKLVSSTAAMLEVFESWRGAMRALELIGRLAKPLSYILSAVAAMAAMWAAFKTGRGS